MPFDHPLWVLYSSGTTGLPKAIVHGQGGILLEHLKKLHLHVDAQAGDRLFWFTTTGWMMWNFLVSGLLTDGDGRCSTTARPGTPTGRAVGLRGAHGDDHVRDERQLHRRVHEGGRSSPRAGRDLSRAARRSARPARRCRPRASAGSTSTSATDTWLFSTCGRHRPVHGVRRRRARSCRSTRASCRRARSAPRSSPGTRTAAADRRGRRARHHRADALDADLLLGRRGRLALPRGLLRHLPRASGATATGSRSPTAAPRSSRGRSDATINRGGIRMGTAEIYRAVLAVDAIVDALVVDVPRRGRGRVDAAVRGPARRRVARPTTGRARSASACARTARRATSRRGRSRSPRSRARCRARCSSCRSSGS